MTVAHLDYEARSGVDITEVGSYRWSIDPQFEIFMAGVSRDEPDAPVFLWINPLFRTPDEMGENEEAEKILAEADLLYAHNAQNEVANTWGAMKQGKACPFKTEPPLTIWRCTAAMARKAGLPFSLDKLGEALSFSDPKDREGKALIRFFCIPDENGLFQQPQAHPDKWNKFCDYCRQDVRAEKEAGRLLKPFELSGAALATFQFDQRMNHRGIPINLVAARNAQKVIEETQAGVVEEFRRITGLNPTQREKVQELVGLANMQGPTVEMAIKDYGEWLANPWDSTEPPAETARKLRILELYQKVSYAAVKKIQVMLDCACPDGRIRGMFMYYGAGTGRWSAQKLQPHNFKKTPPWMRTKEDDITDGVYQAFCDGMKAEHIEQLYGEPLEVLSGVIRNFIHLPGVEMLDGDFAQVEARIICWLAGQEDVLQMWREGIDLYKWMAGHVYGIPADQVTPDQREVGKRIILGCFGADTQVLTSLGLKPITEITSGDWLWDGLDWVRSDGVIFQGCKNTINLEGVNVTPQHAVLREKTWHEAGYLEHDGSMTSRALGTALGSLLSSVLGSGNVGEFSFTEFDALVDHALTTSTRPVSTKELQRDAIAALRSKLTTHGKSIGATPTSCRTGLCASVFSTAFQAALPDATVKRINSFIITVVEEYVSTRRGGKTAESFSVILSRLLTTPKLQEILTGKIPTRATNRATCASRPNVGTSTTADPSQNCKSESSASNGKMRVYDVANAGPRSRFTIWTDNGPLIVHNCGFQMGWRRFITSCRDLYQLEVPKDIAKRGVKLFRALCKKIRDYWWTLNNAAIQAIETGQPCGAFSTRRIAGIPYLLFRLRSGRSLAYPHPEVKMTQWVPDVDEDDVDEFGEPIIPEVKWRKEITYWGQIPGSGQWGRIKLYGGKLAENETQATAADFMAHGSITAESRGMEPFMLVHDQGLAPRTNGQTAKDYETALGTLPSWANGFPMKVEAKVAKYYKK